MLTLKVKSTTFKFTHQKQRWLQRGGDEKTHAGYLQGCPRGHIGAGEVRVSGPAPGVLGTVAGRPLCIHASLPLGLWAVWPAARRVSPCCIPPGAVLLGRPGRLFLTPPHPRCARDCSGCHCHPLQASFPSVGSPVWAHRVAVPPPHQQFAGDQRKVCRHQRFTVSEGRAEKKHFMTKIKGSSASSHIVRSSGAGGRE